MKWNEKLHYWEEDEWLTDIYVRLRLAREAVEKWGGGHGWDNNRELQITRYFRKGKTMFEPGEEVDRGDPALCEKVWLRYAEYTISERSDE